MTPLSAAARLALLGLARWAIARRLDPREPARPVAEGPELAEPRGAFVTLRRRSDGELRGCVGVVEPRLPLHEAVVDAAVGAAFRDHRFGPVSPTELEGLRVEVSVLGALAPTAAEAVEPGVHGVLLRLGDRSGLLLPQVAVEHGWDRDTLLEWACRKAGVPPGAWRDPRCGLFVFTAERFEEDEAAR
jgi:AmmeMemoRadiSam system protein A